MQASHAHYDHTIMYYVNKTGNYKVVTTSYMIFLRQHIYFILLNDTQFRSPLL